MHRARRVRGRGRPDRARRAALRQRHGDAREHGHRQHLRPAHGLPGPVGVYVHVPDVDEHHARAVAHGVEIVMPPTDQDYGSRDYMARDAGGNVWSFGTYAPGAAAG
ncbi:VOC family protein [Streptomyces sp. SBR177]